MAFKRAHTINILPESMAVKISIVELQQELGNLGRFKRNALMKQFVKDLIRKTGAEYADIHQAAIEAIRDQGNPRS